MNETHDIALRVLKWCRKHLLFCFLLFTVLLRLYFASQLPLIVMPYAEHDDALLEEHAWSILSRNWLGEYNSLTLVKGVTFPFFLILSYLSGISYPVLLCLTNILSVLFLCFALKPLFRSRLIPAVLFVLLIWSPVTNSAVLSQRVYRNALCFSLTLFVTGGFTGIYLRSSGKISAFWYIMSGISLFLFSNLREDSVWLWPFVICASSLTALRTLRRGKGCRKTSLRNCSLFLLTFGILAAGNLGICSLNLHYYGVFTRNDRTGTAFNDTAEAFLSAYCEESEKYDPGVVLVCREQYELVISKSRTLTEVHDQMMEGYDSYTDNWQEDGQCDGDFYIWALRTGGEYAGVYSSARNAAAFWEQVSSELKEAYSSGELTKRGGLLLSGSSALFHMEDLPGLLLQTCRDIYSCMDYSAAGASLSESGPADFFRLRRFEVLTGSYINYCTELTGGAMDQVTLLGRLFVNAANVLCRIAGFLRLPLLLSLGAVLLYSVYSFVRLTRKKDPQASPAGIRLLISLGLLLTAFLEQMMVCWFIEFIGHSPEATFFYAPTVRPLTVIAFFILLSGLLPLRSAGALSLRDPVDRGELLLRE